MAQVWLNGRLLNEADAAIAVGDRGFLLGDGLFETMRAYAGRVFRLAAHLRRLADGAGRIGLDLPFGLSDAVRETVAANRLRDGAVRLTVTRGAVGAGLLPPASDAPATVLVTARPYRAEPSWYERGLSAALARGRLDENRATAGLKHTGYLEAIVAVREAAEAGFDDALFRDAAGHLAEGAASNLFVVVGETLCTPPLSCGVLPGITRAAVLELAAATGIEVREAPLELAVLSDASEAFLTSSLRELVPLVRVRHRTIGDGRPGPLTGRLLEGYRRLTGPPEEGDA